MAAVSSLVASSELTLEILTYPLADDARNEIISLLRTEWVRTDFDWLEAMYGDYSEDLEISSVVARVQSRIVATATVLFNRLQPEVAILANVLTHRQFRGRGIGSRIVETAVSRAETAGCRICLLGSQAKERNLYGQIGFERLCGAVMYRRLQGGDVFEKTCFSPEQKVVVRAATWQDWPALTHFSMQTRGCCILDYVHGIISARCNEVERCASTFPFLFDSIRSAGGRLYVVAAVDSPRVLGFGSVTPGTGASRRHTAVIDLAVHENYEAQSVSLLRKLLRACGERGAHLVYAHAADVDAAKRHWLLNVGFTQVVSLPEMLSINGRLSGVTLLGCKLSEFLLHENQINNSATSQTAHEAHRIGNPHISAAGGR